MMHIKQASKGKVGSGQGRAGRKWSGLQLFAFFLWLWFLVGLDFCSVCAFYSFDMTAEQSRAEASGGGGVTYHIKIDGNLLKSIDHSSSRLCACARVRISDCLSTFMHESSVAAKSR
jgi:hypothetical protein